MLFKELERQDRDRVSAFYQQTSYSRPISKSDRVFVAEDDGMIYGAVRIESNTGVQVLRGMYMHPDYVRKGIGQKLLKAIEPTLSETDSYCIPRDHLFDFYRKAAFQVIAAESAPGFLFQRLAGYIEEGLPVSIMYRPPGQAN